MVCWFADVERRSDELAWTEGEIALDALEGVVDGGECPCHPIGEACGERRERTEVVEERFTGEVPAEGYVPSRNPSYQTRLPEEVRAFVAE